MIDELGAFEHPDGINQRLPDFRFLLARAHCQGITDT
jgi:hypothetical protein